MERKKKALKRQFIMVEVDHELKQKQKELKQKGITLSSFVRDLVVQLHKKHCK